MPNIPQPKKLADILTMRSWEVEDLKRSGDDWILDISILPNRMSDASGHMGVAREISAILNVGGSKSKFILSDTAFKENKSKILSKYLTIRVLDRKSCPRYMARAVFNIKVAPSPKWLSDRLIKLGVAPINNIVDVTNYVLLETGQPLHAFDYDKLTKNSKGKVEILVRKASDKEKITTLDDQNRILSSSDLVIADKGGPLAIAGIKGGVRGGISKETKNIIIEAANFDPITVYKTSKKLNIETDAAKRFAAGLPKTQIPGALNRAVYLINKIAQGAPVSGAIDTGANKQSNIAIPFSLGRTNSMLGTRLSAKQARSILSAIGCTIKLISKDLFRVTPPSHRLDLVRDQDLIEEIGRLYGYENIKAEAPKILAYAPETNSARITRNKTKDFLVKAGFIELRTYSFVGEALAAAFGLRKEELIELDNPMSEDKKFLQPMITPRLLAEAMNNFKYSDELNIFEISNVFEYSDNKINEREHLTAIRAIKNNDDTLNNFRIVKGVLSDMLAALGLSDVIWRPADTVFKGNKNKYMFWSTSSSAVLEVDGKSIGVVGMLRPDISSGFSWPHNIVVAEINFSKLVQESNEEHEYRLPSRYPEAVRDIAVLVDGNTLVDEVGSEIARIGKSLIRDIELFDYYEGENLPEGKKSLAFRVIYQSQTRTLSGKEIDDMHKNIITALSARGWEVR